MYPTMQWWMVITFKHKDLNTCFMLLIYGYIIHINTRQYAFNFKKLCGIFY